MLGGGSLRGRRVYGSWTEEGPGGEPNALGLATTNGNTILRVPCECNPPSLLEIIGYVASFGFLGSIVGYIAAGVSQVVWSKRVVDPLRWAETGAHYLHAD
jgi:hypothetical protein